MARCLFSSLCFVSGITGWYKSEDAHFPVPLSMWEQNSFEEETLFREKRGKGMNLAASYLISRVVSFPLFLLSRGSKNTRSVWNAESWIPTSPLVPFTVRRSLPSLYYSIPNKLKNSSGRNLSFLAFCPCPQTSPCNSANKNNSQWGACLSF